MEARAKKVYGDELGDLEPQTLEEYVASSLRPHSINYEGRELENGTVLGGVLQELGYKRGGFGKKGDTGAIDYFLAAKGKGESVDAIAEGIWSSLPEQMQEQYDSQDVKNALLDVLSGAERTSDITRMVLNNRIADAEQRMRYMEEEQSEHERQEAERLREELLYQDYLQQVFKENPLSDEDIQRIYGIFVEVAMLEDERRNNLQQSVKKINTEDNDTGRVLSEVPGDEGGSGVDSEHSEGELREGSGESQAVEREDTSSAEEDRGEDTEQSESVSGGEKPAAGDSVADGELHLSDEVSEGEGGVEASPQPSPIGKGENKSRKVGELADNSVSLQKKEDSYEISERVPQGERTSQDEEGRRDAQTSRRLRERAEAYRRDARANSKDVSRYDVIDFVNAEAEKDAKASGMWIPLSQLHAMQGMRGGNENDVYFNPEDNYLYKMNNLMNSGGDILRLLDKVELHNQIFPETRYALAGFTGHGGGVVYPVLKQRFVQDATEASIEDIDAYMESLGFEKVSDYTYTNGDVTVSDMRPRNVLKDSEGDIYVVDCDIVRNEVGAIENGGKENSALDNTTDTVKTQRELSKRNDTATPQDTASEGKDTQSSGNKQGKGEEIEVVNERYNQRLRELDADPTQKDRVLRLGRAGDVLRRAGIADAEIEMEYDRFVRKSGGNYENAHPFTSAEIQDLPKAINAPIAVFDSADSKVVLTELQKDGKNFIVAIRTKKQNRKGGVVLEVNEITTLYPKNAKGIVNWINTNKGLFYDKQKTLHWVEALRPLVGTTITNEEFNSAAKIVENFENPKVSTENNSATEQQRALGEVAVDLLRGAGIDVVLDESAMRDVLNASEQLQEMTRFRWNSGYTERADGSVLSVNAMEAEEEGRYDPIRFRKQYKVSKPSLKTLYILRAIDNPNGEYHHVGKNYDMRFFYKWNDDAEYSQTDDGKINIPNDSYASKYKENKKKIDALSVEFEEKKWSEIKVEEILSKKEFLMKLLYQQGFGELTENDKKEQAEMHAEISAKTEWSASSRWNSHRNIDRYYYYLPMERRAAEAQRMIENGEGNEFYEEYVAEQQKQPKKEDVFEEDGKERVLLQIGELMGLDEVALRERIIDKSFSISRDEPIKFLRTAKGEVYGFVKDGKVYLDPKLLNPNTPIHEYTHLWDTALQKANPELWKRGVELMKGTSLWESVQNDPAYKDIASDENLLASEVHARLAGAEGAKLLADMQREIAQSNDGIFEKAQKISIIEKLKSWIKDTWQWVKDTMTPWTKAEAQNISLAQFVQMPIADLVSGNQIMSDNNANDIDAVNERFNEQLEGLTEENADSVAFDLGRPSAILRAAGVEDMPMKLYGNKVIKKMKKHGFSLEELRDLPNAVANPIAVFNNYQKEGNRSILTELRTAQGNFLVTIDLGKDADIDFNIISSVFGKGHDNIIDWINKGYATYINKEKAHAFLSHQSAPIAAAAANAELLSVAKVIENFENPKVLEGKVEEDAVLFRAGEPEEHERKLARADYEERVKSGMYQLREALQDSMLGLKVAMESILGSDVAIDDVADFENAYLGENRLSSVNKAEADAFAHLLFKPMLDEVARLAPNEESRQELVDYMFAKHGLERNVKMAERNAEKSLPQPPPTGGDAEKILQELIVEYRKRDYSGITALVGIKDVEDAEREAQYIVDTYENNHDMGEFWNKVNAVSDAILSKQYECGMMSRETYDDISGMYEYYIPLRGFDETTSATVNCLCKGCKFQVNHNRLSMLYFVKCYVDIYFLWIIGCTFTT